MWQSEHIVFLLKTLSQGHLHWPGLQVWHLVDSFICFQTSPNTQFWSFLPYTQFWIVSSHPIHVYVCTHARLNVGSYCHVVICVSMLIALAPICLGYIFLLNPELKGMANLAGHPAPFCFWVLESQVCCHAYFAIWKITPASVLHPSCFCNRCSLLQIGFLISRPLPAVTRRI